MKAYQINIKVRKPKKSEYGFRGTSTYPKSHKAKIFIRKDTIWMGTSEIFFHELAHTYLHFFHYNKLNAKRNEALADEIGTAVAKIVHKYIYKEKWNFWHSDNKLKFPTSWSSK
jgi:hypothetical protein